MQDIDLMDIKKSAMVSVKLHGPCPTYHVESTILTFQSPPLSLDASVEEILLTLARAISIIDHLYGGSMHDPTLRMNLSPLFLIRRNMIV